MTTDYRIYDSLVPPPLGYAKPGDEPSYTNYIMLTTAEGHQRKIPLPKGVAVELHIEP